MNSLQERMVSINKKIFLTNCILGASVALFIYFLKSSLLLEKMIACAIILLAKIDFALFKNRYTFAPTSINVLSDLFVVAIAAFIWTSCKTARDRIAGNVILSLLLIPAALFIYRSFGVIVTSPLIVFGIIIGIFMDAVITYYRVRFQGKMLDEKQEAEFSILRHINHNVKPNIQIAKSPIHAVMHFLDENNLSGQVLARRLDGSEETVGDAMRNVVVSLNQINDILDNTRKIVSLQIRKEEFRECHVVPLIEEEIVPLYGRKFKIIVEGDSRLAARLHRESFLEALNNLIRNAEMHAFPEPRGDALIAFDVAERRRYITIDYTNNGKPFPANLSARDFLSFGRKSGESPGEGLGGAWIGKVIEAHRGTFEVIRDEHPLHFRITLPKRGI